MTEETVAPDQLDQAITGLKALWFLLVGHLAERGTVSLEELGDSLQRQLDRLDVDIPPAPPLVKAIIEEGLELVTELVTGVLRDVAESSEDA